MMNTRHTVCAFLRHGDELLMLHRGQHKKIAPGMWSGVGGHIEQYEMNDPRAACLRELQEEAGVTEAMLRSLRLQYITVRETGAEIAQNYVFFGELTDRIALAACDEGALSWVALGEVADLPMSFSVKHAVLRWLACGDEQAVWLCGINHGNDMASWIEL